MGLFWVGSLRAHVRWPWFLVGKTWRHVWTKRHLAPQTRKCLPQKEPWTQASEIAFWHVADNFGVQESPVLISTMCTCGAVWTRKRLIVDTLNPTYQNFSYKSNQFYCINGFAGKHYHWPTSSYTKCNPHAIQKKGRKSTGMFGSTLVQLVGNFSMQQHFSLGLRSWSLMSKTIKLKRALDNLNHLGFMHWQEEFLVESFNEIILCDSICILYAVLETQYKGWLLD